jgi:hypothetical protein
VTAAQVAAPGDAVLSFGGGNKTGLGDLRSAVPAGSETRAEHFRYRLLGRRTKITPLGQAAAIQIHQQQVVGHLLAHAALGIRRHFQNPHDAGSAICCSDRTVGVGLRASAFPSSVERRLGESPGYSSIPNSDCPIQNFPTRVSGGPVILRWRRLRFDPPQVFEQEVTG